MQNTQMYRKKKIGFFTVLHFIDYRKVRGHAPATEYELLKKHVHVCTLNETFVILKKEIPLYTLY